MKARLSGVVLAPAFLSISLLSSCAVPPADEVEDREVRPAEGMVDRQEVEEVARVFLEALSQTDTTVLRSLMAPGLSLSSVRAGPEGPVIGHSTGEEFLIGLGGEDQELLERMWDPVVYVQGQVAMVWTPYDFFLNGEFSHCGIDVFTMLQGGDGWMVTSITYDVVREGCPPSPLGPPVG